MACHGNSIDIWRIYEWIPHGPSRRTIIDPTKRIITRRGHDIIEGVACVKRRCAPTFKCFDALISLPKSVNVISTVYTFHSGKQ